MIFGSSFFSTLYAVNVGLNVIPMLCLPGSRRIYFTNSDVMCVQLLQDSISKFCHCLTLLFLNMTTSTQQLLWHYTVNMKKDHFHYSLLEMN
jgi:hypothetical protein